MSVLPYQAREAYDMQTCKRTYQSVALHKKFIQRDNLQILETTIRKPACKIPNECSLGCFINNTLPKKKMQYQYAPLTGVYKPDMKEFFS